MHKSLSVVFAALSAVFCFLLRSDARWNEPPTPSQTFFVAGFEKRLTPSSDQVTFYAATPGLTVTIQPGKEGYPGVRLAPPAGSWDLSRFGHVEARVVNTGTRALMLALRVDNAGGGQSEPWNTESVTLAPGERGTVTTIFGYAYDHKPGYALKSRTVVGLLLFTNKSDAVQSFRVESLTAGGPVGETPPVAPENVRVRPVGGALLGPNAAAAPQIATSPGVQASASGNTLRVVFPASGSADATVSLKPAVGRWDLRDSLQVAVRVRNAGKAPVTPRVHLETNGGPSDTVSAPAPLAPGASATLAVPFAPTVPIDLGKPGTESRVTSDAVSAVVIASANAADERVLIVESVRAEMPPAPTLPAWLGKRPPVAGEWIKTLDDEFNGASLDTSIWSIAGENYWDQQSHWSRNDVFVGNGVVRLRYEKKTGHNNDDPTQKQTPYAAGYLHTYDKWTQRYGYFEARMKLPTAPGLWPAVWMMPDRGDRTDPQWKRQDTGNGAMEFDIMEHLTRWGPTRYNIAMHYDGYGKDHKSLGSDRVYVQPDKDGFITCGLLWTPGSAVYYCNGREVLRWENPRISSVPSILMFTLPQGGWDNSPIEDAKLPADFVIDYVRVWQRKDLASPADGKKIPAAER